jgi:hypothetical protein
MRLGVSGGVSPNELRELLNEYGSVEALVEARPDLADLLHGVERIGGQLREAAKMMEAVRLAPPVEPEAIEARPSLSPEVEVLDGLLEEVVALRRALVRPAEPGSRDDVREDRR